MPNPLTPEENREQGIKYLRGELRLNLTAAIRSVDNIVRDLDDLSRDDLYDVEYAEGGRDVQDMRTFLADARRFLVAAEALNPCRDQATPGGAA